METQFSDLDESSDSDSCISVDSSATASQPHPLMLYTLRDLGAVTVIQVRFQISRPMMEFLSPSDLLSIRAVCQAWRMEVTPLLRDKLKIVIKSDKDLKNFTGTMSDVVSTRLPCSYVTLSRLDLQHFRHIGFYDQITVLSISLCEWTSHCLRSIVFEHFPSLQRLELEASPKSYLASTQHILPMSVGQHSSLKLLPNLRSIHLIGDFARESDIIYEILKYANNLEAIKVEKSCPGNDDLFGTWFFEIVLSRPLPKLTGLEIDSALIDIQVESLLRETEYPLTRLRLNLTQVQNPIAVVRQLLRKFRRLENAEFELHEPTTGFLDTITRLVSKEKFSISIHSDMNSRIT